MRKNFVAQQFFRMISLVQTRELWPEACCGSVLRERVAGVSSLVCTGLYCLSNLELDSLVRLGNWFNCFLLLMHINLKIKAELRKSEGNLG